MPAFTNDSSSSVPSSQLNPEQQLNLGLNEEANAQPKDPEYEELFNFSLAKPKLQKLISSWQGQITRRAAENREWRYKDLNIKQLRESGTLRPNEFMIPVRSIDQNIRREQPSYINFIKQSKRLVIFKDLKEPTKITTELENEFSRGMTYSGWETPLFRVIDGAQTHGWDWCEVTFDESKPLHVGIEHVGFEKLIFPLDAHDIQACQIICREYSVSPRQLQNFVLKFNFNKVEVDKQLLKLKDAGVEKNLTVYKEYFKYQNVVYVAWFCDTADDWLFAPKPHYLGRKTLQTQVVDVPTMSTQMDPMTGQIVQMPAMTQQMVQNWVDVQETLYPVFRLPYIETERAKLCDVVGRVFLDKHKQEAKTANVSQFINACQKSSEIYIAVDTDNVRNEAELQNITIEDDKIIPVKVKFFSPPPPDSTMLGLQNYLDAFDSQEAGRMDFAAMNRQDSRKTATEVAAAREETAVLGTVQVSLLSRFLRELYTFIWEVVKSQAAQNKITFLAKAETELGVENDIEQIDRPYEIRAAGDIDVVRRLETIAQYKEFWPIVQNTHIAIPFLARLIRMALPEDGDMFAKQLEGADPRAILAQLVAILEATLTPQEIAALDPMQQQTLMQVMMQAKQVAQQYAQQTLGGSGGNTESEGPEDKTEDAQEMQGS